MKQINKIRILKGGLENFAKDENFAKENVRHALLKELKTFESRIGRKKTLILTGKNELKLQNFVEKPPS